MFALAKKMGGKSSEKHGNRSIRRDTRGKLSHLLAVRKSRICVSFLCTHVHACTPAHVLVQHWKWGTLRVWPGEHLPLSFFAVAEEAFLYFKMIAFAGFLVRKNHPSSIGVKKIWSA